MVKTNWAGNVTYRAPVFRSADSIPEVQDIVASARKLRVLGSRHSFNAIADSNEVQLSLDQLNNVVSIDETGQSVTVEGGIRYGELAPALHEQNLALANLASLPHISVAGAVATATHGSGSDLGNLATSVTAMDIITADGDLVSLSRESDGDTFDGSVVALGALGVVARITLDVEPGYEVRQRLFTDLSFDVLADQFDAIFASARSVSIFTDWTGDRTHTVWVKEKVAAGTVDPAPEGNFFGAPAAPHPMHPLPGEDASVCTEQMGIPGPWYARLPHFRMEFSPSLGAEIQAEYFMPREESAKAIAAMRKVGESLRGIILTSELRTVAADRLWMSPGSRGDYVAFHFTFKRDWDRVQAVLPAIEAALAPLGAVPHWGKVTTMPPALFRSRYARFEEFRELARSYDPGGKFRNDFLEQAIFAPAE